MSLHLLDANVLLALAWPMHDHNTKAQKWFQENTRHPWATCTTTQLAFIRLSSNPKFTKEAKTPHQAALLLQSLIALPNHRFIADPLTVPAAIPALHRP